MTKVAVYARYSTGKQREASIDDQVRNCTVRAEREGWEIGPVYADKAVSGSKRDRPEYNRMLAAAEAREFDALLVDDLSRLSRDDVEQGTALRKLIFWEVRVVGVSDGYDSAMKGHKMVSGMRGVMNNVYLDDLREKTHRGLTGKALAGQNTGGRTYGYENAPIEHPSAKDQYGRPKIDGSTRQIDPDQAKIVRQIFKWFAEGRGYVDIANRLNKRGVPSPRGGGWAGSTIRPMLANETYVGRVVWNKREWVRNPETGKRVYRERPESEWIVADDPKLRIIDDDLWQAVKARRGNLQAAFDAQKKMTGNPGTRPGKAPQLLFSGIVKCGVCGANYIKVNATHYRCSAHGNKGTCDNKVTVRRDVMEPKLLHSIKTELFTENSLAEFKAAARKALEQRLKDRNKSVPDLRKQLVQVDKKLKQIIAAIEDGGYTRALTNRLRELEAEQQRLESELDLEVPAIENIEGLLDDVVNRFARMAYDFEEFAGRDVTIARNMIRALVGGSIILSPTKDGGLVAEMQGHYSGLVELLGKAKAPSRKTGGDKLRLVAGAGFEPTTFRL